MPDRRRFLKQCVATSTGAIALTSAAGAQNPPSRADANAEIAKRLTEVARLRFGTHLNDEQLRVVEQRLTRSLTTGDLLKRTRLENSDEPAFVFIPEE
jgi:hypothetical protein